MFTNRLMLSLIFLISSVMKLMGWYPLLALPMFIFMFYIDLKNVFCYNVLGVEECLCVFGKTRRQGPSSSDMLCGRFRI